MPYTPLKLAPVIKGTAEKTGLDQGSPQRKPTRKTNTDSKK